MTMIFQLLGFFSPVVVSFNSSMMSSQNTTGEEALAHYIDDNMKLQTTLIGLRRVIASHSGEVIAEQVVPVIQEYGFE